MSTRLVIDHRANGGSSAPALRHPEKAHRPNNPIQRKPAWIRVKAPTHPIYHETRALMRANGLVTVCEEAACPNIGECWSQRHATMMIMGDTCTRACAFCNVATGQPAPLAADEPARVADAVAKSGSPTSSSPRWTATISPTAARRISPPPSAPSAPRPPAPRSRSSPPTSSANQARPKPSWRPAPTSTTTTWRPCHGSIPPIRPGARYFASLNLLHQVKQLDPTIFTKSGLMVGLGESRIEIMQVMDDLRPPTWIS